MGSLTGRLGPVLVKVCLAGRAGSGARTKDGRGPTGRGNAKDAWRTLRERMGSSCGRVKPNRELVRICFRLALPLLQDELVEGSSVVRRNRRPR